MTARLHAALAAGLIAALPTLPARALQIDGLDPLEPIVADAVVPRVAGGELRIAVAPQRMLRVTPWPAYLPQRFGAQSVTAVRQLHPAGPIDRLSLRRGAGGPAWLEIGTGARRATAIVGAWRLHWSARGWTLRRGDEQVLLGESGYSARPAPVADGRARWCIYLLDSRMPRQQPGSATEDEPQAAWAALKLDARQRHCPAPRAAPR